MEKGYQGYGESGGLWRLTGHEGGGGAFEAVMLLTETRKMAEVWAVSGDGCACASVSQKLPAMLLLHTLACSTPHVVTSLSVTWISMQGSCP